MSGRGHRSPERDAAFRRIVEETRARHNISDLVARKTKVTRAGREKVALCLFHQERSPSMRLNDAKGTYHCFGCGASGDIIKLVMGSEGLGFLDALRWLGAADLPLIDPAERIKAIEEDAAARAQAIADARFMWDRCGELRGTPGERYLREVRGINIVPPAVRFGVVPASRNEEGNWKPPRPAVVLAVHHEVHGLVGLQRIFIRDDGGDKRWGKRSKLSLGRPLGGAVRLGYADPGDDGLIICEGPEDGLTLAQELPDREVWVALGTAMMPQIEYPARITSIVIAGQNDAPGRAAVDAAETGLLERGFAVRSMWPADAFKDWNDQLRGMRC